MCYRYHPKTPHSVTGNIVIKFGIKFEVRILNISVQVSFSKHRKNAKNYEKLSFEKIDFKVYVKLSP